MFFKSRFPACWFKSWLKWVIQINHPEENTSSSLGCRRQWCPKDQSGNSSLYCSALSPVQHSYHIHLLWRKRNFHLQAWHPKVPSATLPWTPNLHSSHARRVSSRNFRLTQNQSQRNFSAAIIIRSSLDANSVSECGLQSKLVNNYGRILKPALENKRNVESTRLLEGMEVHTGGRNFLPARLEKRVPKTSLQMDFGYFIPELVWNIRVPQKVVAPHFCRTLWSSDGQVLSPKSWHRLHAK